MDSSITDASPPPAETASDLVPGDCTDGDPAGLSRVFCCGEDGGDSAVVIPLTKASWPVIKMSVSEEDACVIPLTSAEDRSDSESPPPPPPLLPPPLLSASGVPGPSFCGCGFGTAWYMSGKGFSSFS